MRKYFLFFLTSFFASVSSNALIIENNTNEKANVAIFDARNNIITRRVLRPHEAVTARSLWGDEMPVEMNEISLRVQFAGAPLIDIGPLSLDVHAQIVKIAPEQDEEKAVLSVDNDILGKFSSVWRYTGLMCTSALGIFLGMTEGPHIGSALGIRLVNHLTENLNGVAKACCIPIMQKAAHHLGENGGYFLGAVGGGLLFSIAFKIGYGVFEYVLTPKKESGALLEDDYRW